MWKDFFSQSDVQLELKKIRNFLRVETNFAPIPEEIFKVFELISPDNIKVVIIGQDPYHDLNPDGSTQAMGIAFSIRTGNKIPSSLQNILKEVGIENFCSDLTHWVKQGVFLINTALTVKLHQPNSHTKIWEKFTEFLLKFLSNLQQSPIFVLWGAKAQKFEYYLPNARILKSSHPSGLSAYKGFIGCKHFEIINELLEEKINW